VENFDAFRDAALDLIENDPRYLLQVADGEWWVDRNGNQVFEEGIDVVLLSDPLKHAGVHYAHASGLTGSGEVIAFSDGGYLLSHEVFDGKVVTDLSDVVDGHGTAVASIAAGASGSMIGVAPGADLILGDFDSYGQLAETARVAAQQGAIALNNSWGFTNMEVTQQTYDSFSAGVESGTYLDALRDYALSGVVLFAASNDYNATEAGFMEVLPAFDPSLEAGWLSVINGVPLMVDDDIISAERVSGGCLEAAQWCLAADGSWTAAWSGSQADYQFGTGTSFATPLVSGALALLAEAFPDLDAHALRIRLLASADNDFEGFIATESVELVEGFFHDISDEWGHGFIDVKAALMPIGETSIPLAQGGSMEMRDASLVDGGVYGDAISKALAGTPVAAQDALAAQFTFDAAGLVASRRAAPLLPTSVERWNDHGLPSHCCGQSAFLEDMAPVALAFGDLQLDLAVPQNPRISDAFGAAVRLNHAGRWGQFNFSLGYGRDDGRYGYAASSTSRDFISAEIEVRSDYSEKTSLGLSLGLAELIGAEDFGGGDPVRLGHADASLEQRDVFKRGDRLTLSLGMPVAVVAGRATIDLPVVRSTGGYDFQSLEVNLAPENREIQLEARYDVDLSREVTATMSLHHAMNRGNRGGEMESGVFFGMRSAF